MKKLRRHPFMPLILLLLVLVVYAAWAIHQPLPLLHPSRGVTLLPTQTSASNLNWPSSQAAVGIVDSSVLEKHGLQTPVPTASTAKIITALMILKQKPLKTGEQGPTITLTSSDVDIYNRYVAQDGSVVPVQAGEQITEYEALQAVMLPSANNMADSMAIWAYGSMSAYAAAANAYVAGLGLTGTHIGSDASGLAPDTVSTAQDLVRLGELAMQNPVLAQIVGQSTATGIPLASSIRNVNVLLGTSGIVGIKTGNSDQAGGVYVSASKTTLGNKSVTIVTALMGTPDLGSALRDSLPLIKSAQANFTSQAIVANSGKTLGTYALPWGGSVTAVASGDLHVEVWKGTAVASKVTLNTIAAGTHAGQAVGTVSAGHTTLSDQSSIPVIIKTDIPQPSLWWRLLHPAR
ncbi:MAG TPA: serine hydrolase [Candidatus Saccharimonadales bacterium]